MGGMLKVVGAAIFFSAGASAHAQEQPTAPLAAQAPQPPKTKMEAFQGTSGAVIIRGSADVGVVKAVGAAAVEAVTFRNAQSGQESKGLIIEAREASTYTRSPNRAFVDYDEISGLLAGIDYVSRSDKSVTELPSFEATYSTKGEVKITVFNGSSGKLEAAIQVGRFASQRAFVSLEQLTQFRGFVERAQQILDNPKLAAKPKPAAAVPASASAAGGPPPTPVATRPAPPKPKPVAAPMQLPPPPKEP